MPPDLKAIVDALGNAAQQCAIKGAGAADGVQAKDFGAGALAFTQALMLIVAPKPPPGNGQQQPSQQAAQQGPLQPRGT